MNGIPRFDVIPATVRGRTAIGAAVLAGVLGAGCGGNPGPRVPPASAPVDAVPPASAPADAAPSVEGLYDAGRYAEVVEAVGTASDVGESAKETWLAAQSNLKLNRQEEARAQFMRLAASGDPAWHLVGQLAIATMSEQTVEIDRVRAMAETSTHPIVQFEVGLSHMRRNDFAAAAQAFDRGIAGDPALAYAYYYAGLAYQRIDRADLMASRLESFSRLAPRAPERPAVESILRTIRGQ